MVSSFLTENEIVGTPGYGADPATTTGGETKKRSSGSGKQSMMLVVGTFLSANIRVDGASKQNKDMLARTKWNITITDVGLSNTTAGLEVHALSKGGQFSLRSFLPIKKLSEVVAVLGGGSPVSYTHLTLPTIYSV